MPIPSFRDGLSVPEVTSPPPWMALPWRAMPPPVITNGTSSSDGPFCRAILIASAPMKPVSSFTHQPRPASIGPRVSIRSLP